MIQRLINIEKIPMSFSQLDYENMLSRLRGSGPHASVPADAVEDESQLHEQVRAECARHGWVCLMGRMDKRTGRTLGELDCSVITDHGVYFAELKAAGGKLTTEQRGMIAWLVKLGANARVIYSIHEFREFTK